MPYVSEWDVKAFFNRFTIYMAPLPKGAPRRCRLGCEHDTLRLLLLWLHEVTQPIRPTCMPFNLSILSAIGILDIWILFPSGLSYRNPAELCQAESCSNRHHCFWLSGWIYLFLKAIKVHILPSPRLQNQSNVFNFNCQLMNLFISRVWL